MLKIRSTLIVVMLAVSLAGAGPALAQVAAFCNPGEQPTFHFGFATLKEQLGAAMGTPVECEHPNSANGDTLQKTTTGLAFYRKSTNTPTFTDGYRHWGLTSVGIVAWVGDAVDPPYAPVPVAQPAPPSPPRTRVTPLDFFPQDRELPYGFVYQAPDDVAQILGGQVVERSYARPDASAIRFISAVTQSQGSAAVACDVQKQSWRDRGLLVLPASRYGSEGVTGVQKYGALELRAVLFHQGVFCGGLIWVAPPDRHNNEQFIGLADSMMIRAQTYSNGYR